jgi:CMP-N-acetylneuraminic acid synthetase
MLDVLVVIMARKDSKRIPEKNMKHFCNIPLIEYTLTCAKQMGLPTAIFTDFDRIKGLTNAWHPQVMVFDQPKEFQEENVTSVQQFKYVHSKLPAKTTVLLQPTTPVRNPYNIMAYIKQFLESGADSGFSVVRKHLECYTLEGQNLNGSGKDRKEILVANGSFFIFNDTYVDHDHIIHGKQLMFEDSYLVDLDTEDDWKKAEILANGGYYE